MSDPAATTSAPSGAAMTMPSPLPHPPSYYTIPSSTSHSSLPSHTPELLAAIDALPPDAAGYTQVKKLHVVHTRLGMTTPQYAYGETSAPAAVSSSSSSNKSQRTSHADSAPSGSPRNDQHADEHSAKCGAGDEYDEEEAAGAKEAVERNEDEKKQLQGEEQEEKKDSSDLTSAAATTTTADVPMTDAASIASTSTTTASKRDNKKRKDRGQNKPHEREIFTAKRDVRLCNSVAAGTPCTKPGCKFSHDANELRQAKGREYEGLCPIWRKYGSCQAGEVCKWSNGHKSENTTAAATATMMDVDSNVAAASSTATSSSSTPAAASSSSSSSSAAKLTPLSFELNILNKETQSDLRTAGISGPRYEKLFPVTVALMKKHDVWKKKYDKLREQKQNEKQRVQKEQARMAKEQREKEEKTAAAATAASSSSSVLMAIDSAITSTAATPTPSASSSTPSAAASSSSTTIASSSTITTTSLPPTFPVATVEQAIEIAALKAMYTPNTPKRLDPFQIVKEEIGVQGLDGTGWMDWSSGMILIDLERKVFDFKDKLYLAPLTTVGNLPFRLVCKGLGADVTIGEMAMASSLAKGNASEWALLRRHKSEKYFGVQIAAAFPDQVSRACELINKYCSMDNFFVDINFGCPIDPVTNVGMGSAMMQKKRSKNIEPMLRIMTSVLDCPATVKMRMGWSASEMTCMDILPIAARCGIAAATIHGRTRQQRYTKSANWQFIQDAARYAKEELNNFPVIANGDVYTFQDYEEIVNKDSVITTTMIARGALVKPWIFTEIKERRHWDISAGERLDLLKEYVAAGLEHWGSDSKGVETTRRYLLEWLSFLHRYVPVGLLETARVGIQQKAPPFYARNDLEQLLASGDVRDWIRISEMLIGPVPDGFRFTPKHKSAQGGEEGGKRMTEG